MRGGIADEKDLNTAQKGQLAEHEVVNDDANHDLMQGRESDSAYRYLRKRIPDALLQAVSLQGTRDLRLWLLNDDYPQDQLTPEQVHDLMDEPPYWAFCWASGWVLAQLMHEQMSLAQGKRVLDFGCGSGVAGIAALKSGAEHVYFCDTDAYALAITQRNVILNNLDLDQCSFIEDYTLLPIDLIQQDNTLIMLADVFYDRDNMQLLATFVRDFTRVIVADSRLKGQVLDGLSIIEQRDASTLPDLHESADFRAVTVYSN